MGTLRDEIENILLSYAHDAMTFQEATEALLRLIQKSAVYPE